MNIWQLYGEAAKTALGFFWKAGWAFVLGYWVSAMIQAFVPKGRLTPYMGGADVKSISLATLFGAASSSCSFAALAAARSLVLKGAHFVAAVAFMFASTNLVIELGILILIFLGWQFLAAELIGGLILIDVGVDLPQWLVVLENAMVAPFVAAATFIGSMGNIPLATVLNSNGVLFAGIMGFIYSDLMVPPLVFINSRYYGWRVGLYIAGIMFVSVVSTALILHYLFAAFDITPQSSRKVEDVAHFAFDYTFFLNLGFVVVAAVLVFLHRRHLEQSDGGMDHGGEGIQPKRIVALLFALVVAVGILIWLL